MRVRIIQLFILKWTKVLACVASIVVEVFLSKNTQTTINKWRKKMAMKQGQRQPTQIMHLLKCPYPL